MRYVVCPNCDLCFEAHAAEPIADQTEELCEMISELRKELNRMHRALYRIEKMRPGLGTAATMAGIARRCRVNQRVEMATTRPTENRRKGARLEWTPQHLPDLRGLE